MYLNYYRFRKEPFHITPDPEFLFMSRSHREALGSIIYGIEKKKGFVCITGAVGVGKTTILRSYLEKADRSKIRAIYIFNPNVSFKSLLKTIYQELDIEVQTEDVFEMVNHIHYALIEEFKKGHNVVLVIDEAQNIPMVTLENLRMLSNLETAKEKLIQMVLIGQPEFEQMLNKQALRQINQRIAIRSVIQPLTPQESREYIEHRISKVAMSDKPVFTRGALRKIVRAAKGIPRTLNIICDNALITGFGSQKNPVTRRIAGEVIADLGGKEKKAALGRWRSAAAGLALAAAAGGVFWISPYSEGLRSVPGPKPRAPASVSTTQPAQAPVRARAVMDTGSTVTPSTPQAPAKRYPVYRYAKQGDNLSRMAMEVYGFCDQALLERIKSCNPDIKNVHKIMAGGEILFPELDVKKKRGR